MTSKAAQTAPSRGRPTGDRDARRRGIADATLSVIAQVGLDGASLRAIARHRRG